MKKNYGSLGALSFVEPAFVYKALGESEAFEQVGDVVVSGSACLL